MTDRQSLFSELHLFADVPVAALQALDAVAREVHYRDGQVVMVEGDGDAPVFFVCEGSVRVFHTNVDGREQTIIHLKIEDVFNMPTAFARQNHAPATVIAVGDVKLLEISQDDFRRVVSRNAEIALAVLRDLSEKLRHFVDLTHDLSLRSVRARLARFLLKNSRPSNSMPRRTHEEIATQIGTAREVVSRIMRNFNKAGFIKTERQQILILNPSALENEAEI